MTIQIGRLGVAISGGGRAGPPAASMGPDDMISAVTVNADGKTLSAKVLNAKDGGTYSGLNNKAAPGLVLQVSSPSWTAAGVATTLIRNVYATSVERLPYPNGTTLNEVENGADCDTQYSLSSAILSSDTVVGYVTLMSFFTDDGAGGSLASNSGGSGAVTNNSTRTDYDPQAVWLNKSLERITGSSYTAKLFVMHRYAQQGQPVRAVKFTATDESLNSVSVTVSALTTGSFAASGYFTNWYEGVLDFSGLTAGERVTLDAVVYPWVGAAYTISTDAEAWPSANLSVSKVFYDPNAATIYAYVDPVNGNDATAVASANEATAIANMFQDIRVALYWAEQENNIVNGRLNTDGCVITIAAGATVNGFSAASGFQGRTWGKGEVLIRGVNRATSVFINGAASTTAGALPGPIRFSNMTLSRLDAANYVFLQGNNLLSDQIVFDEVTFGGAGYYDAWAYECGREYFFACDGIYIGQGNPGSINDKQGTALAVGCSFVPLRAFNWVACASNIAHPDVGNPYLEAPKGCVIAHSFMSSNDTGNACLNIANTDMGPRGAALVGNILEVYGASDQPALQMASSGGAAALNYIEANNTFVGGRTNLGYNEAGIEEILRDVVSKQSYHMEFNSKSDYFGTNGNLVGNWGLRHGTDCGYRFIDLGVTGGGTTPGYASWLGEALGDAKNEMPVGDVVTGNPDFANDQSTTGGAAGSGDYTPGALTDIPQIPAGETMFAVDLYGTPIPTDGTAYAAAVQ